MIEKTIDRNITIEELIELVPESVRFLMKNGIVCIICGEPIWGTIEEVARSKGKSETEIDSLLVDLNRLAK